MYDVSYFTIEKFDKCFNLISVNVKMQGLKEGAMQGKGIVGI